VDRRTRARELAMQALYQLDVQGDELLEEINTFLKQNTADDHIFQLADGWTKGTWENHKQCDDLITSVIIKWELSRLSRVDKSILRLSVYQLRFCPDIPPKVVINEGIELAKKFSSRQSPGFINGILDAILGKLTEN